ncbi:DNA polymerase III subunit gamma and tau [Cellulomonas cellasea]|uniref:DNA-directed DNA polymerase n=2 Tax=Cellulomonas cellasea TaxID=43670 RepID=A0A7W4UDK7_9CELL|nr:DNA polymerase III subunit gamma and tau [Cellulomonas cellasea]MBB2922221.1 DNA polymerase-3 subunit gamma/tau [Cellulomonas cellasea]
MTTALYRRYRPETFAEVVGQDHVTAPLRQALRTGQVNHAYLFSGPRGCGKTTSARILARCLNCAEGPTDTPCGVCESCVELARGGPGSLDVVEIDAASHGGVDDARDLRERATFAPARDRYKIFILDEAHMVSPQGFNALLKIVEEPPPHIKFIFATTEPDKVIGTIRSRTHHYPFRLIPPDVLVTYLEQLCATEGVTVGAGVLPLVVRAGAGSARDTLSVLDQLVAGSGPGGIDYEGAVALLGYTHASLLDDLVDAVAARDGASAFRVVERVISTGHEPRRFVEDLLERLRDLIVIAASGEAAGAALRDLPADQLARMRAQAAHLGAAELSRSADLANAALSEMTGATSPRLHLELLMARLLLPAVDDSLSGLGARLDRLERGLPAAGTGPSVAAPPAAASPLAPPVLAPATPSPGPVPAHVAATAATVDPAPAAPPAPVVPAALVPDAAASPAGHGEPVDPAQADAPDATRVPDRPASRRDAGSAEGTTPDHDTAPDVGATGPATAAATATAAGPTAASPTAPSPTAAGPTAAGPTAPSAPSASGSRPAPAQHDAPGRPVPAGPTTPTATPPAPARGAGAAVEVPAVAAPPPAAAGAGQDTEMLRRRWPEVLDTLNRLKKATWVLVSQNAQVADLDASMLRLAFTAPGIATAFRGGQHAEMVQRAVRETLGFDVRVEPVLHEPGAAGGTGAGAAGASGGSGPGGATASAGAGGPGRGPTMSAAEAAASWDTPVRPATPAPAPAPAAPPASSAGRRPAAGGPAPYDDDPGVPEPPHDLADGDPYAGLPIPPADDPYDDAPPARPSGSTPSARPGAGAGGPGGAAPGGPAEPPVTARVAAERAYAASRGATRNAPVEDFPSPDDPDLATSGLTGAPLVAQLLGGTIIDEQTDDPMG